MDAPRPSPRALVARLWPAALLFAAYVATAKIGLDVPVANGLVTPVWAPTGIAIAGLTLGGLRLWPAVLLGAFVGNVSGGATLGLAAAISVGNTGAGVSGAWILRRAKFEPALARTRDVVALAVAGLVSCLVSATNGTTVLWAWDFVSPGGYGARWVLWWFGDVMGVLVVGGLLFAVAALLRVGQRPHLRRVAEFTALFVALPALSVYVFSGDSWQYPRTLFPLIVWATIRFRALGATLVTLVLSVVSIGYTIEGTVALPGASSLHTVQILQSALAIVGIGMLFLGAALSERDATRAQLEAALADEQEIATRLRTLDEMKDRLLTAVSHELRTPLTSILALSTMLQDRHESTEPAKRQEMLDHLTRESRRLDSLLSDLLDLERLRRGLLMPQLELVDVPAVMRTALQRYADGPRPMRVELDDVSIEADPAKLDRIVDNLIGNAHKHTPFDKCVSVTLRAVDGGALIAVDDQGLGVPDDLKQAIFEPFHRGAADVTHVPGTGIGLSLVAHFTELHGGRAWVEDRAEGGSSFRVFLPGTPVGV